MNIGDSLPRIKQIGREANSLSTSGLITGEDTASSFHTFS
jgi:hypothetical protein